MITDGYDLAWVGRAKLDKFWIPIQHMVATHVVGGGRRGRGGGHTNFSSSREYMENEESDVGDLHLGDAINSGGEKSGGSKDSQRLTLRGKEEWGVLVLHETVVPKYVMRAPQTQTCVS